MLESIARSSRATAWRYAAPALFLIGTSCGGSAPAAPDTADSADVESTSSDPSIAWPDLSRPIDGASDRSKDAALIVAIEHYTFLARVPGALKNAEDWYRYLTKTRGVPATHVRLLTNNDATNFSMLEAAEELAKQVEPGGRLWFVFVGHGAPSRDAKDGLLVAVDAQQTAKGIEHRSVRQGELIGKLSSGSGVCVGIIDACYSGRASSGEALVPGLQPTTPVEGIVPATAVILSAARSNEVAGALPGGNRPAFSYLALGALRGWADDDRDGQVTASEVEEYTRGTLRALLSGQRSQNPQLEGNRSLQLAAAHEPGPQTADLVLALHGLDRNERRPIAVATTKPREPVAEAPDERREPAAKVRIELDEEDDDLAAPTPPAGTHMPKRTLAERVGDPRPSSARPRAVAALRGEIEKLGPQLAATRQEGSGRAALLRALAEANVEYARASADADIAKAASRRAIVSYKSLRTYYRRHADSSERASDEHCEALYYLGYEYWQVRDVRPARSIWLEVIEQFPNSPFAALAYVGFGEAFAEGWDQTDTDKQWSLAQSAFKEAVKHPAATSSTRAYAGVRLADSLAASDDRAQALQTLKENVEFLTAHPDTPEGEALLTRTEDGLVAHYVVVGKPEKAFRFFATCFRAAGGEASRKKALQLSGRLVQLWEARREPSNAEAVRRSIVEQIPKGGDPYMCGFVKQAVNDVKDPELQARYTERCP